MAYGCIALLTWSGAMTAATMALALRLWYARLSRWLAFMSPNIVGPIQQMDAYLEVQARKAAVALLLKPFQDRDRTFFPIQDSIWLLDDSGGACITLFDDADACHYFLIWLRRKRIAYAVKHCPIAASTYDGSCRTYDCPAWSDRHGGTCAMSPRRDEPCK